MKPTHVHRPDGPDEPGRPCVIASPAPKSVPLSSHLIRYTDVGYELALADPFLVEAIEEPDE